MSTKLLSIIFDSNYIFSSVCRFLLRYETRVETVGKGVHLNLSK